MSRKSRWLLQTLSLSVILNCAFIALFFYFMIRDNPLQFSYRPSSEEINESPPVDANFFAKLEGLSFESLVELLSDKRAIASGYRLQDFSLSALVTFHDLDVIRALGRTNLSQRKWTFGTTHFTLFPGLSDKDFQMLKFFATTEKWPFSSKGLFKLIAKQTLVKCDRELLAFFCRMPEMIALETLIAKSEVPIQRGFLLKMALEGSWESLSSHYLKQQKIADFSASQRRKVLLHYIGEGSKTAAYLFLLTDKSYAEHHLSDEQIGLLLNLLTVKTEEAESFLQAIAHSPRSDRVKNQAIAGRFIPRPGIGELRPLFREEPPRSPQPRLHIVQPGESLWQIAKKYQISLEELMVVNHLQSTVIRSGMTFTIPLP